ncbi:MAG: hypothetical protein KGJ86_01935, partial [Chloroflexota bacterium]|nr:hypothetical protein [Chloroflexota bacterium]
MQPDRAQTVPVVTLLEERLEDADGIDTAELWLPVGARIRALTEEDAPAVTRVASQIGRVSSEEHWRDRIRSAPDSIWC